MSQAQHVSSSAAAANISAARGNVLQRQCACGQHAAGGECGGCAKKKQVMRRAGHDAAPASAPPVVHDVLGTPGRPLDPRMRAFMEPRFGRDFSDVRVHADSRAAASAAAVGARAYTVGRDIVLDGVSRGPADERRLFAHELAHVVQQRGTASAVLSRKDALEIGAATDPAEREAETVADSVLRGAPVAVPSAHAAVLQRDPAPGAAPPPPSQTGVAPQPVAPPAYVYRPDVILGKMSRDHQGAADAVLTRPTASKGGDVPPCQLTIYLKLDFDFHQGAYPVPRGGPGSLPGPEGGPWPAEKAKAWKAQYMQIVQAKWRTNSALEPSAACPAESCKSATGRLRVIDTGTMKDSDGQAVAVSGMSTAPHYTVKIYESRPPGAVSYARTREARLFEEDTLPRNAPPPKGYNPVEADWTPGSAAHETGHMLGRPHVNCSPDAQGDPNRPECYGTTPEQKENVMGRGENVSEADQAPFLKGMQATTGCEWKVSSGGLGAGWIALIASGSVLGTAAIIGGIAYAASKSKK